MNSWPIIPGLWQADLIGAAMSPKDCTLITLTMLEEFMPIARPLHVVFPIVDGPELPDMKRAVNVAVIAGREIAFGNQVYVACNAGQNRSGLIVAMTLDLLHAQNILATILKAHPEALQNQTFRQYVEGLG